MMPISPMQWRRQRLPAKHRDGCQQKLSGPGDKEAFKFFDDVPAEDTIVTQQIHSLES
jgi:hypothetical protein